MFLFEERYLSYSVNPLGTQSTRFPHFFEIFCTHVCCGAIGVEYTVHMKHEIETVKEDFLIYLETDLGRTPKTIETYNRYLSRFFTQMKVRTPRDITETAVQHFFSHLCLQETAHTRKKSLGMSGKTKNYYRVALRMFLRYLDKNGITSLDPKRIPLETVVEHVPSILTEDEWALLHNGYFGEDAKNRRDRAIVHILAETGIKVSELCAVNIDSYRVHGNTYVLVCGVGDKRRVVSLSEGVRSVLEEYCVVRKNSETPLFLNNGKRTDGNSGSRLTPRSVQRIVREFGEKCGISKTVTPSVLRHSVANRFRERGTAVSDMQNMLGHEQAVSTRLYIRWLEKGAHQVQKKQKK